MESACWRSGSRLTVWDTMIVIAGLAISFWIGLKDLLVSIRFAIEDTSQNPSVPLALHRTALVLSDPVQPVVAVWTLTILVLALSSRSRYRQLAYQPGFVACSSAALAIFIVGPMNFANDQRNFMPG